MKITGVTARAVDVGFQKQALQTTRVASPMSRFPRFAEQRASWMWPTKKAFVRIDTEDGCVGWSCTNGGEIVEMIVNMHLARLLVGEDADQIETLWDQMAAALLPNDRSGFAMMAVAAIDIALWDVRARSAGQPLVAVLGGAKRDSLPVYVTTSDPVSGLACKPHGLKAAAPYGPEAGDEGLQANVDLLRRFSDAAGPGTPVMIDAFMAWDADYTLRFAEAARHLPLAWIEDPLPPNDMDGMIKLRHELDPDLPLALGNFAFSRADCAELLHYGLPGILQPDVAWAGGVTEALRILDMAEDAGVPVILHNTCEQPWALAIAAARQTDPLVEFVDRGAVSPLYELMGDRPVIADGTVAVAGSGSGHVPPDFVAASFTNLAPQGT